MPDSTRVREMTAALFAAYPDATCALVHKDAFQLAVATILSAQCTDERVNQVTKALFKKYKTPRALAEADLGELEEDVKPTGFFRAKAKNIQGFARAVVTQHGGRVPRDLETLVTLPGVGRKTANVILGTAYGIAAGVVVDTHVARLSQRLGLTAAEDPVKIEQDLMALLPPETWIAFSHAMIWHGRQICTARKARCAECPLETFCAKVGVNPTP